MYLASTRAHDACPEEVSISPLPVRPAVMQLPEFVQDDDSFFFVCVSVSFRHFLAEARADEQEGGGVVRVQHGWSFVLRGFQGGLVKQTTGELEDVGMATVIGNQGNSVVAGHMIHVLVVDE